MVSTRPQQGGGHTQRAGLPELAGAASLQQLPRMASWGVYGSKLSAPLRHDHLPGALEAPETDPDDLDIHCSPLGHCLKAKRDYWAKTLAVRVQLLREMKSYIK